MSSSSSTSSIPQSHFREGFTGTIKEQLIVRPCGHLFNRDVVVRCLAQDRLCPIDRRRITGFGPNDTVLHIAESPGSSPIAQYELGIRSKNQYEVELSYQQSKQVKESADYYYSCGQFEEALECYQKALQMEKKVHKSEFHPSIANILDSIEGVLRILGRFGEAREQCEKALKIKKKIYDSEAHPEVAFTLNNLGEVLRSLGQIEEALKHSKDALEMQREVYESRAHSSVANTLISIARSLTDLGRFEEALGYFQEALEMRREIDGSEASSSVADALGHIASSLVGLGRFKEALEYSEEALKIWKDIRGDEELHSTASIISNIGSILSSLGRFDEALIYCLEALEMKKRLFGPEAHPEVAFTLSNLGVVLNRLGRFKEALECSEEALEMNRKVYRSEAHPQVAFTLSSLGEILRNLGQFEEAYTKTQEALVMDKTGYGSLPSYTMGRFLSRQSRCLGSLGKFQEALNIQKQALSIDTSFYKKDHPYIGASHLQIGICHYALGNYSEALQHYEECIHIYREKYGKAHPDIALTLSHNANCLAAIGRPAEALEQQKEALDAFFEMSKDREHPFVATCLCNMGFHLFNMEEVDGALAKFEEALEIRQNTLGENHPEVGFTKTCIAICNESLNRKNEILSEEHQEEKSRLEKKDFEKLLQCAMDFLEAKKDQVIELEKNPSGFVRLRLKVSPDILDTYQIETLRLHYWPPETKIDIVEALHSHPNYFESMILKGGYTHNVYKQSEELNFPELLRAHRIVKLPIQGSDNPVARNIFCLGTTKLDRVGEDTVKENDTRYFPRNLVHQVMKYEPKTLTINAVFKNSSELACSEGITYFDVYKPQGDHLDPQVERECLPLEEGKQFLDEIKEILKQRN